MNFTVNVINDYLNSLNLESNPHYFNFLKKCKAILSKSVMADLMESLIRNEIHISDFFEEGTTNLVTFEDGFNDVGITNYISALKASSIETFQKKFNTLNELLTTNFNAFSESIGHNCSLNYLFAKSFDEELDNNQNEINYNTEYFKLLNTRIDSCLIPVKEDENCIDTSAFWKYNEVSNIFSRFLNNSKLICKVLYNGNTTLSPDDIKYRIREVGENDKYVVGRNYYIEKVENNLSSGEEITYFQPVEFFSALYKEDTKYYFVPESEIDDLENDESPVYIDKYICNNPTFNSIAYINDTDRREIVKAVKEHNEISWRLTSSLFSSLDINYDDTLIVGKGLHNTNNYPFFLKFSTTKFPDTIYEYPIVKKLYYGLFKMNKIHVFNNAKRYILEYIIKNNSERNYLDFSSDITEAMLIDAINTAIVDWHTDMVTFAGRLSASRVYLKQGHLVIWEWRLYNNDVFDSESIHYNELLKFLSANDSELVSSSLKKTESNTLKYDYYRGLIQNPNDDGDTNPFTELEISEAISFFSDFPHDFFDFLAFYMMILYYIPVIINNNDFTDANLSDIETIKDNALESYRYVRSDLDQIMTDLVRKVELQTKLVNTDYKFILDSRRIEE